MKTFDDVMLLTGPVSSPTVLEDEEARALYDCCVEVPEGGLVVEVGCQLGRSSSILTQCAAGRFKTVHIDPYTSQPEMLMQWHEMMLRIGGDQEHAYTHLCMRTEQARWLIERLGTIDLAFIDGDHQYQGVLLDLRILCQWIAHGGFLVMHDYHRESIPEVTKAADDFMSLYPGEWEHIGVFGTLGVWRRK